MHICWYFCKARNPAGECGGMKGVYTLLMYMQPNRLVFHWPEISSTNCRADRLHYPALTEVFSCLYSCGHLYHSLCLLSKECGVVTKGLMRWMCYKCNSSNKGGKLSENFSELKKGSATSLAQVRLVKRFLFKLTSRLQCFVFTLLPDKPTVSVKQYLQLASHIYEFCFGVDIQSCARKDNVSIQKVWEPLASVKGSWIRAADYLTDASTALSCLWEPVMGQWGQFISNHI